MRITANQLTTARLLLIPLLTAALYAGEEYWGVLLCLGVLIGCTDFVDGYLARKHGTSVLGGLLDPIADKVFVVVAYIPYVDFGWAPWWLIAPIFLREFLVTALRSSFEMRGLNLPSGYLAKIKTWVQMVGIGLLMLMLVIKADWIMYAVLGFFWGISAGGWILYKVLGKGSWRGGVAGILCFGVGLLLYAATGLSGFPTVVFALVMIFTWVSAIDYLRTGLRLLTQPSPLWAFDLARVFGAITVPLIGMATLAHIDLVWVLIALLAIEVAHVGLDNLLAHHRVAASAVTWGVRIIILDALLIAALLLPPLWNDVCVSLAATVGWLAAGAAFFKHRQLYIGAQAATAKTSQPVRVTSL
ncbi:MAG: CDP-alcohol phosphatidyltransferase family protein [Myxococcota bacterium]